MIQDITSDGEDVTSEDLLHWRNPERFTDGQLIAMMDLVGFGVVYDSETEQYSVKDYDLANLNNVEDRGFNSILELFKGTMGVYMDDILSALENSM